MGHYSDLGTGTVHDVDPTTGFPRDKQGHLLDPTQGDNQGPRVEDWNKPGAELYNLTSPYGFLHFAIGSGDDFVCFDYTSIRTTYRDGERTYLILHAVRNSETGGFIEDAGYQVLPIDTPEQKQAARDSAIDMMDEAFGDVKHSERGWNQDPWYFARCVDRFLFPEKYTISPPITDRQMRHGGKRVNRILFRDCD